MGFKKDWGGLKEMQPPRQAFVSLALVHDASMRTFPWVIGAHLSEGCLLCTHSAGATTEYIDHISIMCSKWNNSLVKSKSYVANRMGMFDPVAIHNDMNHSEETWSIDMAVMELTFSE